MAEEHEIKLLLKIPLEDFLHRALDLGFSPTKTVRQVDTYFDTPKWDLYHSVSALRIRSVDDIDATFTYKKLFHLPHRPNPWFVEEIEETFPFRSHLVFTKIGATPPPSLSLKTSHDVRTYLLEHGFLDSQVLQKTRNTYAFGQDVELVVDAIEDMPPVVEIESRTSYPLATLENLVGHHEWERTTTGTNYLWMERHLGLTYHLDNTSRFKRQPDWNVTPHERSWYEEQARKNA